MMSDHTANCFLRAKVFPMEFFGSDKELQVMFYSTTQGLIQTEIQGMWLHLLTETCLKAALGRQTDGPQLR